MKKGLLRRATPALCVWSEIKTLDQEAYWDYYLFLKMDKEGNSFSFRNPAGQIFSCLLTSSRTCTIQCSDFYTLHSKYHPALQPRKVEDRHRHRKDRCRVVLSRHYSIQ